MLPAETTDPRRHVLMTADAVGGVWTYALDLARGLGARGTRVSLAVMGPPPTDAQRTDAAAISTMVLHECMCSLEWMEDPWLDVAAAAEWLLALEHDLQPDVVHLNGYCHADLAWHAPVLVAGHSCVLSWWRGVHAEDAPPRWDTYAARVRNGLRAADLVVAPTQAMLSTLDFDYGPLRAQCVIANGRSAAKFLDATPERKEPFVLTAGRLWDEAKNVAAVAAVAGQLSWPVYLAGATASAGNTATLPAAAHHLGRLGADDMARWMTRAAIFALPARYEPFGLSALEAALAGCALVLGDIRSQREIWGDDALYVPPDNRRALVATLERLASDEPYRIALGSRAQRRARALTHERMADAYAAAYAQLPRTRLPLSA
jgi:glycogen synthase